MAQGSHQLVLRRMSVNVLSGETNVSMTRSICESSSGMRDVATTTSSISRLLECPEIDGSVLRAELRVKVFFNRWLLAFGRTDECNPQASKKRQLARWTSAR